MDHLRRLIVGLLLVLLGGGAAAIGTVPVTTSTTVTGYYMGYGSPVSVGCQGGGCSGAPAVSVTGPWNIYYSTVAGVCGAVTFSITGGDGSWGAPVVSAGTNSCTVRVYPASGNCSSTCLGVSLSVAAGTGPGPSGACPSNSTLSGGNCTCNLGYKTANPDGTGACTAYTCPSKASPDRHYGPYASKPSPDAAFNYCDTVRTAYTENPTYGCVIGGTLDWVGQGSDGSWYADYMMRISGSACQGTGTNTGTANGPAGGGTSSQGIPSSPPSTTQGEAPPSTSACAAGTCPGTVNGASVCVACSNTVGTYTVDTTAPSGSASAPTGTTVGSKTVSSDCAGTSCTTTTTTKDAGGAVLSVVVASTSKDALCKATPGDPVCLGSGSGGAPAGTFGGSCSGGFTCTGDAVQCAMARDQLARNCQTLEPAGSSDPAVVAAAAGIHPATHPYSTGTTTDLSGGFDQTNIITGSCPADVSVAVSHFGNVTLPFASLCTPAGYLGNILLGITALSCLGIVFLRRG